MTEHTTADRILIRKLTEIILANLENKDFGVQELARLSGVSRTGLNRKLRKITDKSLNQFISEVRLRRALEILLDEEMTASEVAYRVGFSSPAYFNTCFHKCFGFPPGKVKDAVGDNPEAYLVAGILPGQKQNRQKMRIPPMKSLSILSVIVFIALAAYISYPHIFNGQTIKDIRSSDDRLSVAVMPFQNLTNDTTTWNIYQDIIQNSLTSYLSNFPEDLCVRQTESVNKVLNSKRGINYATITPSLARATSKALDADVFIEGTIIRSGNLIRLSAQLTDTKTEEIITTLHQEGAYNEDNFLHNVDSLSEMVKNFILLSILGKEEDPSFRRFSSTNYPEAYRYYLYGNDAFHSRLDWPAAINLYKQALEIDSTFFIAAIRLVMSCYNYFSYTDARRYCMEIYEKRDQMSVHDRLLANMAYALIFETPLEVIKYNRQLLKIDDQMVRFHYMIGYCYMEMFQYHNAIPELKKALEIYDRWSVKPMWVLNYLFLGKAYHETQQYRKERKVYRKAEIDFPDNPALLYRQAILALSQGKMKKAEDYIARYKTYWKENSRSEAGIANGVAEIYSDGGIPEKAEEYYRQALSLEPENVRRMNNLAYFLIDTERNIEEGMALIEVALGISPGSYTYLHTKGWGLYKQGKYTEALEILQKSWDIRRKIAIYDHKEFLHLEEAKKAVRDQKTVAF